MTVKQLDHLNLTVKDFNESAQWYKRVFGFEIVEEGVRNGNKWGILQSGDALLCIYQDPSRTAPGEAPESQHRIYHFGLRITDRQKWEETIAKEHIQVEYGGAIDYPHSLSWYLSDPTGHEIEVALWQDDKIRFAS
jgi:catechol-2,3-dioxygenase